MNRLSTTQFAIIVSAVVVLALATMAAVVGLEIANRPVSTVVELYGGLTITTIPSLFALVVAKDTNYTVKNGLKTDIINGVTQEAAKVAAAVATTGTVPVIPDPPKDNPYA